MAKDRLFVKLSDGTIVRYSILVRHPEPYLYVRFRSADGRRVWRSSGSRNRKLVIEELAEKVIAAEYLPGHKVEFTPWDEAVSQLEVMAKASGKRVNTVKDYLSAIRKFRASQAGFHSRGPDDVSAMAAKRYLVERTGQDLSPFTIAGEVRKLSSLWEKWFIGKLGIVAVNPWSELEVPTPEKEEENRILSREEVLHFLGWLDTRYGEFRTPYLYALTKLMVGSRSLDLASLETDWLREGRIRFPSAIMKGKKDRYCKLAPELFEELKAIAGPRYVWENFPEGLKAYYLRVGGRSRRYASGVKEFTPERFSARMLSIFEEYNKEQGEKNPAWVPFTPHNLRGTAMTAMLEATNGDYQRAAEVFKCHPQTLRKHYAKVDETRIADEGLDLVRKSFGDLSNGSKPQERSMP